jgi:hypothetical protein
MKSSSFDEALKVWQLRALFELLLPPAVSVIFMGNNLLQTLSIARGRWKGKNRKLRFIAFEIFSPGSLVSEGFSFLFLPSSSPNPLPVQ